MPLSSVRNSHKSTRLAATLPPCRAAVAGKVQTLGRMKNVKKGAGGLPNLINLINIFLMAPALTDITSNFTSPKITDSIEMRLPTPSPQGQAEQIWRGTWQSEGEKGQQESHSESTPPPHTTSRPTLCSCTPTPGPQCHKWAVGRVQEGQRR
ncbi:MAG: hypothetical protein IBX40_04840 [Methanosarcinales archaeon]|nr:hypothetical protein [Methanosarcinales archaeon]